MSSSTCRVRFAERMLAEVLHVPQDATCCDDHEHCCPSSLPVCDTIAGRCLSGKPGEWEASVPWVEKVPPATVSYASFRVCDHSFPWSQLSMSA